MKKILWISPYSLHDRVSDRARQAMRMVKALANFQHEVCVLSPTIFTSADPLALDSAAADSLLNSQDSFQLTDGNITFVYIRTFSQNFQDMIASEQRELLNEFTPMLVDFRPDVIIANNCDVVTLCCLNLAKRSGIATAFVLQESMPPFFSFADVDLILSTSHQLIARHVYPLKRIAAYIGPFTPTDGPLSPSKSPEEANMAELGGNNAPQSALGEAALRQNAITSFDNNGLPIPVAASASSGSEDAGANGFGGSITPQGIQSLGGAGAMPGMGGRGTMGGLGFGARPLGAGLNPLATSNGMRRSLNPEEKGPRVMLVDPSLDHGLGIFLELYKHMEQNGKIAHSKLRFVVLETQTDQFARVIDQYYERGGRKAYTLSDFKNIRVIKAEADQEEQLKKLLPKTTVLMLPNLTVSGTSFVGLQALSYGVPVLTTDQTELRDLFGPFASYVDVEQDVINNLSSVPPEGEIIKWEMALDELINRRFNPEEIRAFLQRFKYEAGEYRLLIALMPLLEQCCGNNPHLIQNAAFSMRLVRKQQALEAAVREAAASLLDPLPNKAQELEEDEEDPNAEPTLRNNFDDEED